MKNILKISLVISIFLLFFFGIHKALHWDEHTIEIGQTWEMTLYNDNPYKENVTRYKKVIDIKDNHVLFVQDGTDTLSDTKYWFVLKSKCFANCD
tara:strand:- start:21629 stop:21913 length:285 start_codon:yes stop_codon:yes gene_type:complete